MSGSVIFLDGEAYMVKTGDTFDKATQVFTPTAAGLMHFGLGELKCLLRRAYVSTAGNKTELIEKILVHWECIKQCRRAVRPVSTRAVSSFQVALFGVYL